MARRMKRIGAGRTEGRVVVRLAVGAALAVALLVAAGAALAGPPPLTPGNVLWKQNVGGKLGVWAPAVAHGMVYVSCTGTAQLVALDAAKGGVRWTYTAEDPGPMIPTVAEDEVLITTRSCTVETIAAKTGRRLWTKWLASWVASSPAVHKGTVYVAGDEHSGQFSLLRLNLRTGSPCGSTKVGADVRGTPVVTDQAVYVTTLDGRLKAIGSGRHSKLTWEYPSPVASIPAVQNGRVFVATLNGGVSQVEILDAVQGRPAPRTFQPPPPLRREAEIADDDAPEAAPEAAAPAAPAEPQHGRDTTTVPVARRPEDDPAGYGDHDFPGARTVMALTPAVVGGRIFAATADGGFTCSEAGSGHVVWGEAASGKPAFIPPALTNMPVPLGGAPSSGPVKDAAYTPKANTRWAAPAVAGGKVYVGAVDGELACFDAVTGDKLWSEQLGGAIRSCPAVVGGRVYVTCDDGFVYCVDAGEAAADGWPMWGGGPAHTGSAQ